MQGFDKVTKILKKKHSVEVDQRFDLNGILTVKPKPTYHDNLVEEIVALQKELELKLNKQNAKIDQQNTKLDQLKIRNEKEKFNKIETDEEKLRNSIF